MANADTKRRISERSWDFWKFSFDTLIRPWPPYLAALGVIAVVGTVTPILQIKATTGLIDTLMERVSSTDTIDLPLPQLVRPFMPWLLMLVGTMILHSLIFMASFQHYLAANLATAVLARNHLRCHFIRNSDLGFPSSLGISSFVILNLLSKREKGSLYDG